MPAQDYSQFDYDTDMASHHQLMSRHWSFLARHKLLLGKVDEAIAHQRAASRAAEQAMHFLFRLING